MVCQFMITEWVIVKVEEKIDIIYCSIYVSFISTQSLFLFLAPHKVGHFRMCYR